MRFPSIDTFSFIIGFVTASVFWWLVARIRPLLEEVHEGIKERREVAQVRRSTGVEENHRRLTLRRAQGSHLAAPMFALDEIIEIPRLLAPPVHVEPGLTPPSDDIVSQSLPYLPNWPELAAVYNAPTLSLPEALSGGTHVVVTGQPGVGKTVALAHLASIVANRAPEAGELSEHIPFFLHVADLNLPVTDSKNLLNPIIDAASEQAGVFDLTRLPGMVQLTFNSGHALLLLDGFDELPPSGQIEISEYLKSLLKAFPRIQVVTTGAPEYLDGLVALGFVPLALMPWNQTQRNGFIAKWGQLWMQTVALESWAQAENGLDSVDPVLLNAWMSADNDNLSPLELTLKLWAGYAGDSLGAGTLNAIATHIRRLAPSGTPLAALETLGMQAVLAAQPIFDVRGAREWVKSFEPVDELPEAQPEETEVTAEETSDEEKPKNNRKKSKTGPLDKKEQVKPTSGLLGKMRDSGLLTAHSNNRMRFLHPLFGGYLASYSIAAHNATENLLEQPDWTGKFLAMQYITTHSDASRLVEAQIKASNMPLHLPLLTASRWLKNAPANAPWRGKVFTKLIEILQTEGIPLTLRAQAVAAFVHSGDSNAQALFRQFLKTTSFELLQLAALGSGGTKDPKAIELLAGALFAPSTTTQRAACLALVAIGTSESMEVVARALLQGEDELRQYAAEAMANDPVEGQAMLKEGLSMNDILLRRAVIFGLKRVREAWAIQMLEGIQIDDEEWVVRNAATEVLDSIAGTNLHVPRRLPAPSETAWLIEFAGKQGTGISPGSPATEVLLSALKSDNIEEQLAALPYLKRTPSEGVISNLYNAMYSDNWELREAIFIVLCELAAGGIKLPNPQQFGLA